MALFGGTRPRAIPGVVPYYPTPEEQAMAVPARPERMAMARPAPSGMFGTGIPGGALDADNHLGSIITQAMNQSPAPASVGQPGSILAGALAQQPSAGEPRAGIGSDAISGELPQARVGYSDMPGPIDLSQARVKKPSFFQQGGLGEKFGDVIFSLATGMPSPGVRRRLDDLTYQRRLLEQVKARQSERDEWTWREQWKREHPDDQFTQYLIAAGVDPRSTRGQALYRQRAELMATPPTVAVDGFDAQGNPTKTFMPRTGPGGAGGPPAPSGPAPGTVKNGYRFNGGNPNDRTSWVPVGGASSNGGATFR